MGRLQESIAAKRFVITAEITPPRSANKSDLMHKVGPLGPMVDALNVTDSASARSHMSALAAAAIFVQEGIDPIMQITCRDRNRIALQSDMIGAAALGIHNFLMLKGDDPKAGDQPDAKPVFDLDSKGLLETAAGISKGVLPGGGKVAGQANFFLGAADMPVDPKPDWKPAGLQVKMDAGASFAQTQFCMDMDVLKRYIARLAQDGIPDKLAIIVGVAPLLSPRQTRWIKENLFGSIIPDKFVDRMDKAADPKAEGVKICIELLHEMSEIKGVAGAHIMAPLNDASIPEVVKGAGAFGGRAKP